MYKLKIYFFSAIVSLLASTEVINAQITYQSSDYAAPLDSFLMSEAPEAQLTFYNFDTAGANFTWVFDTLPAVTQKWHYEEEPDQTGYKTSFLLGIPYVFPGCIESCVDGGGGFIACTGDCNDRWDSLTNAVLTWDTINLQAFKIYDIYNFYANTGTDYEKRLFGYKVDISGITSPLTTILNTPDVLYRFPIAYGNSDSSESSFAIDIDLGFAYTHWQKRFNVVDGWGSLQTPYKSYSNTLRVKSLIHSADSFILDSGEKIDLSAILPDSIIEYKWFDLNFGVPVLTVKAIVQNGIRIYVNAEYLDTLRCMVPVPLFGYLPIPTYLDISNDSVRVNFYNLSINYDSLIWNFGDTASGADNTSGAKNPSHWYTSQGIYITTLTVCNTSLACISTVCTTLPLPIVVIDTSQVYANFVYKPLFPCGGDTVFFTNTSVNDTAWFWDFGDGYTDTAENPLHIYSLSGSYQVLLVAYNGSASDTMIKTIKTATTPSVNFTYSDTITLVPVQFTNTSAGVDVNTTYLWTFGGGKPDILFSTNENPVVTFDKQDTVTTCQLALNSLGCANSLCKEFFVTKCLDAKFITSGVTNNYCINDNINCSNQTTTGLSDSVSYEWYKDAVLTSANINTIMSFSVSGEHTITLIANNGVCSDSVDKKVYLKEPAVLYSAGTDTTICFGDTIQLTPTYSTGGQAGALYNWQPSTGLSAVNIPAPYAYPDTTTEYIFTFQVIGGACNLAFSDKDTLTVFVDTCVVNAGAIGGTGTEITIYPNPNNGRFIISTNNGYLRIYELKIYNTLGETVMKKTFTGSYIRTNLFIADLPAGIYFYRLVKGTETIGTGKLIIE